MKQVEIIAPIDGKLVNITEVKDEMFSKKMLGDGFAILPTGNEVIAPFKGKIVTAFHTGHAYGIKHKSGFESLIHIGIDTVELKGKGFEAFVKQGEKVKPGKILAKVDFDFIKSKKVQTDVIVVFLTESMTNRKISNIKLGDVKKGEIIATIE